MAIKAVIFDYGLVLSGPADPAAHARLRQLTGLGYEAFEEIYWNRPERQLYDKGHITGLEYWRRFLQDLALPAEEERVAELTQTDARMWTTENPAMVAWTGQLKAAGVKTAILSNMGDAIAANIERRLPWTRALDHCVWSWRLRTGKPDPAVYLHTLNLLGTKPEETLFLDDRERNLTGARAVGMESCLFEGLEALRQRLRSDPRGWRLPLPALPEASPEIR